VNYTWSKALGTQSNDLPGVAGFGAPHILDNHRANYGALDFNRPQNFSVNWVWGLPKATGARALGYALNDWQLSGIYRYGTGQPYNIGYNLPGGLSAFTFTGTQNVEGARVVLLKSPGSGHSGDPYRQFDTTALALPQTGSQGFDSGRNFLYRAPINSLDLSLSKRFQVKEKAKFEIRLDAFNALNHTQFDTVNTTLNSGLPFDANGNLVNKTGFGAVTSVRPPRNLQLGARFEF
jgi:hypothetical protein